MPSLRNDLARGTPQPELPFVPPLARGLAAMPWARLLADGAYIVIAVTSWVAGNILAILGCIVVAFLVIAHGEIDLFFSHVHNLASRYVAADAARRLAFHHQVIGMLGLMSVVTFAVRAPRFYLRLRRELREGSR